MLWTRHLVSGHPAVLYYEDYEDSPAHVELTERLRKTLYYGKSPNTDRHSLPVTELAVEFFQDAAPRQLGKVDTYMAASCSRRACMSPSSLMLSMIYIDRLKHRNPEYLQKVCSADLFLISMMVASKYLYDEGIEEEVFNDEWAESSKTDVEDLNELEWDFLQAIDWNLFVTAENFWSVLMRVERELAARKGWEHGFYTYTDSWVLAQDGHVGQLLQAVTKELVKMLLVCSVAYVGCLLTMVGATVTLVCVQQNTPVLLSFVTPDVTTSPLDHTGMQLPAAGASGLTVETMPKVSPLVPVSMEKTRNLKQLTRLGRLPLDVMNSVYNIPTDIQNVTDQATFQEEPVIDVPECQKSSHVVRCRNRRKNDKSDTRKSQTAHRNIPLSSNRRDQTHLDMTSQESSGRNTQYQQGLKLPGLLTLTLIKDTFLQFMGAVKETLATTNSQSPLVCSCGPCPEISDRPCWNVTNHSLCAQASVTLQDLDPVNDIPCSPYDLSRCCCSRKRTQSSWTFDLERIQPPLYDVVHGFSTRAMVT